MAKLIWLKKYFKENLSFPFPGCSPIDILLQYLPGVRKIGQLTQEVYKVSVFARRPPFTTAITCGLGAPCEDRGKEHCHSGCHQRRHNLHRQEKEGLHHPWRGHHTLGLVKSFDPERSISPLGTTTNNYCQFWDRRCMMITGTMQPTLRVDQKYPWQAQGRTRLCKGAPA